jgi:hypothetical protein
MEKYLRESRLFVFNATSLDELKKAFINQPEQYILKEDYNLIFPNDLIQSTLVDILALNDFRKVQMLLLIQVNIALLFLKGDLITFNKIYNTINLDKLIKKYPIKKLLFYLYELYLAPGIIQFLVQSIFDVNLDLVQIIQYKEPTLCLNEEYWQYIDSCFYTACQIEKVCLNKNYPKEIPYWLYRLIVIDKYLPLNSLVEFITKNQHHFIPSRSIYGYDGFVDLKIACSQGKEIAIQRDRKRPISTSSSTPIKKKKKRKVVVLFTNNDPPKCELCINKQPCFACDIACTDPKFTACHEDEGGEHLCKDDRNRIDKERRRDGEVQFITLKNGKQLQGYRMNNMIFTCKGHSFNTTGKYVHCPTVSELHNVLSVSLRLYVYDNTQYRFGTLKTSMRVLEGENVYDDFVIKQDCSILPMQMQLQQIVADETTFTFSDNKKIIINGDETKYKKSSIRVYKIWDSITTKFHEALPIEDTKYCISYGILEDVQKTMFNSITYT